MTRFGSLSILVPLGALLVPRGYGHSYGGHIVKDLTCVDAVKKANCPSDLKDHQLWYVTSSYSGLPGHVEYDGGSETHNDPGLCCPDYRKGSTYHKNGINRLNDMHMPFMIQNVLRDPKNSHIVDDKAWRWFFARVDYITEEMEDMSEHILAAFAAMHSNNLLPEVGKEEIRSCLIASHDVVPITRDELFSASHMNLTQEDHGKVKVYVPAMIKWMKFSAMMSYVGGIENLHAATEFRDAATGWSKCFDMMYHMWADTDPSPAGLDLSQARPYKSMFGRYITATQGPAFANVPLTAATHAVLTEKHGPSLTKGRADNFVDYFTQEYPDNKGPNNEAYVESGFLGTTKRLNIDWSQMAVGDWYLGGSDVLNGTTPLVASSPSKFNRPGKFGEDACDATGDCGLTGFELPNLFASGNKLTAEAHALFKTYRGSMLSVKQMTARKAIFHDDPQFPLPSRWLNQTATDKDEKAIVAVLDKLFGEYLCNDAGKIAGGFKTIDNYLEFEAKAMHQYMLGDYTQHFNDPASGLFKSVCSNDNTYPIIFGAIVHGAHDEATDLKMTLGQRVGLSAAAEAQFKAGHIRYKLAVDELKGRLTMLDRLQGNSALCNTLLTLILVAGWSYWCWLCGLKYRCATHHWVLDGKSWKSEDGTGCGSWFY